MTLVIIRLASVVAISLIMTPIFMKIAYFIGAVDNPNERKVHSVPIPRIGGLAFVISFYIGALFLWPLQDVSFLKGVFGGSLIIVITGFLDDLLTLSAINKLFGQVIASNLVILSGLYIKVMHIPFIGQIDMGWWGIPLTFIWILTVTNAINLIDGLDGLAAGISVIVLSTIVYLGLPGMNEVVQAALILIASILGFLVYNFHPAKTFMGDTGALFLGFIISVLSLLEFKNVTVFSLLVPALILGVPLSDTIFAIIRRVINKQSISSADKSHLHHSFLKLGFSHLQTVLIIYSISSIFSLAAIIFSRSTLWFSISIIFFMLLFIELLGETLNLLGKNNRPLMRFILKVSSIIKKKD